MLLCFFYLVVVAKGLQHGAKPAEVESLYGVSQGVDLTAVRLPVPHVVAWHCRVDNTAGTCRKHIVVREN